MLSRIDQTAHLHGSCSITRNQLISNASQQVGVALYHRSTNFLWADRFIIHRSVMEKLWNGIVDGRSKSWHHRIRSSRLVSRLERAVMLHLRCWHSDRKWGYVIRNEVKWYGAFPGNWNRSNFIKLYQSLKISWIHYSWDFWWKSGMTISFSPPSRIF